MSKRMGGVLQHKFQCCTRTVFNRNRFSNDPFNMIGAVHAMLFGDSDIFCKNIIIFPFLLLLFLQLLISEMLGKTVVNMISDGSKKGTLNQARSSGSMVIREATSDPSWGWATRSRVLFKVLADLALFSASIFLFHCKILDKESLLRSWMIVGEVCVHGMQGCTFSVVSVVVSVMAEKAIKCKWGAEKDSKLFGRWQKQFICIRTRYKVMGRGTPRNKDIYCVCSCVGLWDVWFWHKALSYPKMC